MEFNAHIKAKQTENGEKLKRCKFKRRDDMSSRMIMLIAVVIFMFGSKHWVNCYDENEQKK